MNRSDIVNQEMLDLYDDIERAERQLEADKAAFSRLTRNGHQECIEAYMSIEGHDESSWEIGCFLGVRGSAVNCPVCDLSAWLVPTTDLIDKWIAKQQE